MHTSNKVPSMLWYLHLTRVDDTVTLWLMQRGLRCDKKENRYVYNTIVWTWNAFSTLFLGNIPMNFVSILWWNTRFSSAIGLLYSTPVSPLHIPILYDAYFHCNHIHGISSISLCWQETCLAPNNNRISSPFTGNSIILSDTNSLSAHMWREQGQGRGHAILTGYHNQGVAW